MAAEQRHRLLDTARPPVAVGLVGRCDDDRSPTPGAAGTPPGAPTCPRCCAEGRRPGSRWPGPTRVWAARWMTVSTRRVSRAAASSVGSIAHVAVDALDGRLVLRGTGAGLRPGDVEPDDPASRRRERRGTTEPPSSPAAPVTRTERPRQSDRVTPTSPTARLPDCPEPAQEPDVADVSMRLPERLRAGRRRAGRSSESRSSTLVLEARVVAVDHVERPRLERP